MIKKKKKKKKKENKKQDIAGDTIPRTGTSFLLISSLDGYSFAYVHVKGIIEF